MKSLMIVPALLALWAQPAFSGDGDAYDDVYETYRYESRVDGPDYGYDPVPAYDASGSIVIDDAAGSDTSCEVEREWSPGRYRETVECEED